LPDYFPFVVNIRTMKNEIKNIADLLLHTFGTDISIHEEEFLNKSIQKRLSATGNFSLDEYYQYLKDNSNEMETFFDSLHISFSEFFRNPLTFSVLEQLILPILVERIKSGKQKELRIWSAACAAGQEAFSFAILFDELLESTKANLSCHIFATDINAVELLHAAKGVYPATALNKVTLNRVQKYFTLNGDSYTIAPELRKYIDCSIFNLLTDKGDSPSASIYGNFDVVFCSNILFYYKPQFQERILEKISKNIVSGGYLITGETEREIVKKSNFREVFPNSAIFQKIK